MTELELSLIDASAYSDHASLRPDDVCYCLGEYAAHRGRAFSLANEVIEDFKVKLTGADEVQLKRKETAIYVAAKAFRAAFISGVLHSDLKSATLVPVPPSAIYADPVYDDRMMRLISEVGEGLQLDIRELVRQQRSTVPVRGADVRPTVSEIAANYYINERAVEPVPTRIWIFDDVLVGGNHFKAMQSLIRKRFPGVPTVGMFIARRVPDEADRLLWRDKIRVRADSTLSSKNNDF